MSGVPRVAIVAHRFACPGGIQTCFLELIEGLAEIGIVPEVVWDEPTDWGALGNPGVRASYGGGTLGVSSGTLRKLPRWLSRRLRPVSLRMARLDLERYDFIFSFEDGIRLPKGKPNLCYAIGPPFVRLPEERLEWRDFRTWKGLRELGSRLSSPLARPDRNANYVTLSEWIADLFEARYGFRPPIIWPPARSRTLPIPPQERRGFLFLSRLQENKNADRMLAIAAALPEERVTVAGAALPEYSSYLSRLRERVRRERLGNVEIVENPSEEAVGKLLTEHKYFVFPGRWEHFGIVTVEAIHAGCLPIVHDSGGQREIVPVDSLRFESEGELVLRARYVLGLTAGQRQSLLDELSVHAERGAPERFRSAMLQPLVSMMGRDRLTGSQG